MNNAVRSMRFRCMCFALVGLFGVSSFLWPDENPEQPARRFVEMLRGRDAAGILNLMQRDMVEDKEIKLEDVQRFVQRLGGSSFELESVTVGQRMRAEDGSADRVLTTLLFRGPVLSPEYPDRAKLRMVLLWVLEDRKWTLERPMEIVYSVASRAPFPTAEQEDISTRLQAALSVLEKIGPAGKEDAPFLVPTVAGSGIEDFRDLERLHVRERGNEGVDRTAGGVDVLLRAVTFQDSGIRTLYHGDFRERPDDSRRPVPWEVYRDYVSACVKQGVYLEANGKARSAENMFRGIITLGRRFIDSGGGLQSMQWGLTFQKVGAEELARFLTERNRPERQAATEFLSLVSRRLDLVQTILGCLDDMADYRSLKAALIVADHKGDKVFAPWAINSLAIFAIKGAPADPQIAVKAGTMVLVSNDDMQKKAAQTLTQLAADPSGSMRGFIEQQQQWVRSHPVYGTSPEFR